MVAWYRWYCPSWHREVCSKVRSLSEPPESLRSRRTGWINATPGKGCADATFTLKAALETLRGRGQESWGVLCVDMVQAYRYDTVNR
jgi:hypothetical protein